MRVLTVADSDAHMDKLTAAGVLFTNGYATPTTCTPGRLALTHEYGGIMATIEAYLTYQPPPPRSRITVNLPFLSWLTVVFYALLSPLSPLLIRSASGSAGGSP